MATTWFAQNSTVNIDSASQWNSIAAGGGTVLTFANLDPTDTLVANGKTAITCNVSFTCAEIRTLLLVTGASGGGFTLAAGVTITANVLAGTTTCLTRSAAGAESFVVGTVTGSAATANAYGLQNSSTGTVTVTGDITAGGGTNSYGLYNSSTGAVTVTGNITGGSGSTAALRNNSTGTVTVTGNITGGSGSSVYGLYNQSTGALTVTGNVTGGSASAAYGLYNASTATTNITGNVTGGTVVTDAQGILNNSNGLITVTGNLIAGISTAYISSLATGILAHNGSMSSSSAGRHPLGPVKYIVSPTVLLGATYFINTANNVGVTTRTMTTAGVDNPIAANVRLGVVYNDSVLTGTLIVPAPQYVNAGVGTDNTVGTLATPTAAAIATAVWTNTTAADFTTALSVGKSIMNGVSLGTGLTIENLTNAPTVGDLTATMKSSVTAAVPTVASIQSGLATPTNITAGTITTVTNLTNAPTAGDLTATMKSSVTAAVPTVASIQSGLATPTNITAATGITVSSIGANVVTASALAADAVAEIADGIWEETTSGHTTSGTYGGRIVRATNSNVEVQITGANHIAADVHEFQPGVITAGDFAANAITASALAADAVAEIQSGLATAANLLIVSDGVGFLTSVMLGTISDAGTAGETYVITFGGATYTSDFAGLDATGNRTGVTRTKV